MKLLERLLGGPDPRHHLDRIAELLDGLCDPDDDDSFWWRHGLIYALIDKVTHLDARDGVIWREIPVTVPRRYGTSYQGLVPEIEYLAVQLGLRGASAAQVVELYRDLRQQALGGAPEEVRPRV